MNDTDFRARLRQSQQWVNDLLAGLHPEQLHDPTPCDEFDVTALIGHLMAVQERIRRIGADGTLGDAPFTMAIDGDPAAEFARRVEESAAAWQDWPVEELWSKTVTAPFGTVPGGAALLVYTSENLAHGWDLAVATGQDAEADPAIVTPVLAGMRSALPAENRGGLPAENRGEDIPFAAVIEPVEGAGPTEQLANWLGRSR